MSNDDTPYRVLSPNKVWLSRTARQLASMAPMSERDMAKHLLEQHRLKEAGLVQKDGDD